MADDFMFSGWDITYRTSHGSPGEGEGRVVGSNFKYPIAEILNGHDLTTRYFRDEVPGSPGGFSEGFEIEHLARRVRIVRDLVDTVRYRITGLEVEISRRFLDLQICDVIGYLPRALRDSGLPTLDWLVYEKTIDLDRGSITLSLVERRFSEAWHYPTPEEAIARADYDQYRWEGI